jgi:hypothetical protein
MPKGKRMIPPKDKQRVAERAQQKVSGAMSASCRAPFQPVSSTRGLTRYPTPEAQAAKVVWRYADPDPEETLELDQQLDRATDGPVRIGREADHHEEQGRGARAVSDPCRGVGVWNAAEWDRGAGKDKGKGKAK